MRVNLGAVGSKQRLQPGMSRLVFRTWPPCVDFVGSGAGVAVPIDPPALPSKPAGCTGSNRCDWRSRNRRLTGANLAPDTGSGVVERSQHAGRTSAVA